MTLSYTKNLHLAVPDFLTEPWHAEFAQAMDSIDRILYQSIIAANTSLWENDHAYVVGDLVIDPDTGGIFSAAVAHTSSPSPQTFTAERLAHPTYWTPFAVVLATQAEAEAGVDNTKYMSPLRVSQAIDAQAPTANIASQAEAISGTNNTQMMTPLRVAQSISARARAVPQGRLTLLSDMPIMGTPTASTPFIYYTPFSGTTLPIWNGSAFDVVDLWDQLPGTTTGTPKDPGPVGSVAAVDWFVWADSATVTVSIASPAVVTYNNHGFLAGQPFQFTTTGTLPTGVSAGTTYYVLSTGLTANSFLFSNTRGGTAINAGGSQSGTHTLLSRRLTHGPDWVNDKTRALPISKFKGVWLNAAALANGPTPPAGGTYVGTTRSIGGGNLAWRASSLTPTDPCLLLVYNAYNRVAIVAGRQEPASSWNYNAGALRDSNGSSFNRIWVVDGLGDSYSRVMFGSLVSHDAAGVGQLQIEMLLGEGTPVDGIHRLATTGSGFAGYDTLIASFDVIPTLGVYYAQAKEYGASGAVQFFGGQHYALSLAIPI
jgi:hypothetical protein